jgi:hypothetical protein
MICGVGHTNADGDKKYQSQVAGKDFPRKCDKIKERRQQRLILFNKVGQGEVGVRCSHPCRVQVIWVTDGSPWFVLLAPTKHHNATAKDTSI